MISPLGSRTRLLYSVSPDSAPAIMLLLFMASTTTLFHLSNPRYFALVASGVGVLFFGGKSMEIIEVRRPEERKLIGETCLVAKKVRKGQQSIVRIFSQSSTEPRVQTMARSNLMIRF